MSKHCKKPILEEPKKPRNKGGSWEELKKRNQQLRKEGRFEDVVTKRQFTQLLKKIEQEKMVLTKLLSNFENSEKIHEKKEGLGNLVSKAKSVGLNQQKFSSIEALIN